MNLNTKFLKRVICKEVYDISSSVVHYRSITLKENMSEVEEICRRDSTTFGEKHNIKVTLEYLDNKYTSGGFFGDIKLKTDLAL